MYGGGILPTKIEPTTALATELRFNEDEKIIAIDENNQKITLNINELSSLATSNSNYKYIQVFLNNKKLKDIEPLVLVDMPGFAARNNYHNKAIINYLYKGAYFIILNPVSDGTIQKDIKSEINNITEHNRDFTFCLSKTNLATPSTIEKVKEQILELLEEYDYDKEIICLGDSSGNELLKALKSIDSEKIFKNIFYEELKIFNKSIRNISKNSLINLQLNQKDFEEKLKDFAAITNKINSTKQTLSELGYQKYGANEVGRIIQNTKTTIHNDLNHLANRAINGADISNDLSNMIEVVLSAEINKSLLKIRESIVKEFEIDLGNLTLNNNIKSFDLDSIKTIARGIDIQVENIQIGKINADTGFIKDIAILGINILSVFKHIPIINIATNILSGLLGFLGGGNKEAEREAREEARRAREEAEERAKSKFKEEVMAKVGTELSNIVPNLFKTQVEELSKVIAQAFDESMKEEKERTQKDLETLSKTKEVLDNQINYLNKLINKTQELENKYFKE
ncbi:dynamin family protein [Campylobacter sp. RM9334]|uniref:dynamin family protein n=1 Tax=Campylobacter sp. RM9334 TaxID=2735732 RepID=UPI001DFE156E|nr:dynamin family protein [Campylobacter sp. RM9334]